MWRLVRQITYKFKGNVLLGGFNRNRSSIYWLCTSATNSTKLPDKIRFPNGDPRLQQYLERLKEQPPGKKFKDSEHFTNIIQRYEQRLSIVNQYMELLHEMANEKEKEILTLANEEKHKFGETLAEIDGMLVEDLILSIEDEMDVRSFMIEVQAGIGGQEAMLFAREIFEMYENYLKFKCWNYSVLEENLSDIGGIRNGSIIVRNGNAFQMFQYEAGVHRVQRVPKTEKSGRIHTSTAVVMVIPCPDEIDINLNSADLRIETKRSSAPGGQNVNKLETAVRIVHLPTGIAVEAQEERTQLQNRAIAMKKLYNKLFQNEFSKQASSQQFLRKSQAGARSRNEKLRTYNYPQKRITDHRLGSSATIHNLDEFLNGNHCLDDLIEKIHRTIQQQKLNDLLDSQI